MRRAHRGPHLIVRWSLPDEPDRAGCLFRKYAHDIAPFASLTAVPFGGTGDQESGKNVTIGPEDRRRHTGRALDGL